MKCNIRITPDCDPPIIDEHHVRVPDQVAKILGATRAHSDGLTGKGIRIAVIDSGFYPHPYYLARDYKITPVPTRREPDPLADEYGHGTAQLASLFAIAPESEALVIKCMDRDPSYALRKAIELKPHVLSCAWGFNIDHEKTKKLPEGYRKIHRLIRDAIEMGIVVCAAAGNGQRSFPGNMPEVISVGGVYYGPDGKFAASDVSSSFTSSIFPGRSVPDICGLVGNRPHGRLLLVPVPPEARLARRPSFSMIAAGNTSLITAGNASPARARQKSKGWAMFSGTSAGTAMASGAAALILQKCPRLAPSEVKTLLLETARLTECGKSRILALDRI